MIPAEVSCELAFCSLTVTWCYLTKKREWCVCVCVLARVFFCVCVCSPETSASHFFPATSSRVLIIRLILLDRGAAARFAFFL